MPDFSSQTSPSVAWVDDLLVRDLSGRIKPYHQAKDAPPVSTASPIQTTALEIAPSHELSTMRVSPKDDNFSFYHSGGQAHEPAVMVFHPEDHEQIESFRENLPVDDSKKYSLEKIAQRIAEKNNLLLDDKNIEIFQSILFDFFRNRKNSIITKEYLAEKVMSNGHTLSWVIIDHILSIIKGIKERIDVEGGLVVRQTELVIAPKEEVKASPIKISDEFTPAPTEQISKQVLSSQKIEKSAEAVKVRVKKEEDVASEPGIFTPPLPKVNRPGSSVNAKITVADVVNKSAILQTTAKVQHVLTGPVQELENTSLNIFRRYGENGQERAKKVFQKINILEKESVTKKTQGINAWRKSPVYKLYLDLGARSLMNGQEVSSLIAELKAKGEDVLTLEEFHAIGDLNKLLRF